MYARHEPVGAVYAGHVPVGAVYDGHVPVSERVAGAVVLGAGEPMGLPAQSDTRDRSVTPVTAQVTHETGQ